MSLILVVDPDSRHAAQVASMGRKHLKAEFVTADTGFRALEVLADRVPDIVLTAPLLPGRDEAVLSDYLRGLGDAGAHVQTLTIPILSVGSAPQHSIRGRFRRDRSTPASDGCDPEVFAEQVSEYLQRAHKARRVSEVEPTLAAVESDAAFVPEPLANEDIDLTPFVADLEEPTTPEQPRTPTGRPIPIEMTPSATSHPLPPLALSRATVAPPPRVIEPEVVDSEPRTAVRAEPRPGARVEPRTARTDPAEDVSTAVAIRKADAANNAPAGATTNAPPPARVIEPEVVDVEPRTAARAEPRIAARVEPRTAARVEPRTARTDPAEDVSTAVALRRADAADNARAGATTDAPPPTQHLITLPAMIGDGQQGHVAGSVSVAVAVSVQIATSVAPAAPAAKRRGTVRPVQDEWGFFDPDQCGFRALLARLDAVVDTDEPE
jgi:CheY-like chemotaxis protein